MPYTQQSGPLWKLCLGFRSKPVLASSPPLLWMHAGSSKGALWCAQLQPGSLQGRGVHGHSSWLCSRQRGLFISPTTSWQLEQEAESQWQTVKSSCFGLSLMTPLPWNHDSIIVPFLQRNSNESKWKTALTSSLPSSYRLFSCSPLEGSQLTV